VTSSKAHTNGIGFFIKNSSHIDITGCAAYNNNDNQGGFFMESSNQITVQDSIISHNGFGIKTSDCDSISISYSTISYNTHAGILNTDQSANILITHCNFTKNLRISIYSTQAQITCTRNNIFDSLCGLYSEQSVCDVQQNWWGSWFGPGLIERKQQDNIKQLESMVDYVPWEKKKFSDAGASWVLDGLFEKPESIVEDMRNFSFNEIDTDGDGVPDWWEEQYGYDPLVNENHHDLDPDMDGLNNIEECYTASYGSNPFHRDIFLEFDWMECRTRAGETNKPSDEYIQKAVDIFADHDIALHIDVGNLDGGEQIPYRTNFSFADLKDMYWDYFLDQDITNPRKGIFHYGLICDYGPANGFAVIAWDGLDSFCICAQTLQDDHEISYPRQRFIIGSSIHELGHNLGLTVDDHGGNDNKIATHPGTIQWLKYLTYPSCMNYFYTYLILGFSDGSHGPGDFDDWEQMDLSFFKNTHFVIPEYLR
jgi:parallel beta-helix repeat protein